MKNCPFCGVEMVEYKGGFYHPDPENPPGEMSLEECELITLRSKLEKWEQVWTALSSAEHERDKALDDLERTQHERDRLEADYDSSCKHLKDALERATSAESRLAEMQHSFEIRWRSDQRAIKKWHEAGGHELVWPDHTDLCVWLLEQLDTKRRGRNLAPCATAGRSPGSR